MITELPLDLILTVQDAAKEGTRLTLRMRDPDDPNAKAWPTYGVPVGLGWRSTWGTDGQVQPCVLITGLENSRNIYPVPIKRLHSITTIASRSPGRKPIVLWTAQWANQTPAPANVATQ
jgi:hypothetical protein